MATPIHDLLEYDIASKMLIRTEMLAPGEYGASEVVATNVLASFGLWAEAQWNKADEDEDPTVEVNVTVNDQNMVALNPDEETLIEKIDREFH